MPERLNALKAWVRDVLTLDTLGLAPASGDASFRRYFRICAGEQTYIAMDAPPEQEALEPWLSLGASLAQIGLNVPEVLAHDDEKGFVLMSDLGDTTYLQSLESGVDAQQLYTGALDALLTMQVGAKSVAERLPDYDRSLLLAEMALFRDWLYAMHLGNLISPAEADMFEREFERIAESALSQPRVFVHRDYHSRNLMHSENGRPGILDFQGAVHGPVTYDLVSLLKDCYIAWPEQQVVDWALAFRASADEAGIPVGRDDEAFLRWFDLMGIQRHLKAAGIFARLYHRDGKPDYLKDIPRTLNYILELAPYYPEHEGLMQIVEKAVGQLERPESGGRLS